MKFALFLLAIVVLLWLLQRTWRRVPPPSARAPTPPPSEPQQILACAQCGVHLPRDEALPGRGGVFCGEAHRKAFEQSHPEA